ncbi:SIMPL domain-containing protein [Aliiruegeria sabulilitoris]|uniref:SIMPL domain-containing protein n=1 Tax=Aliiruegeria sabulilitoris TaxID=1510458 RepID=UPI0018D2017E|nr:SIMPL domain-containing protein [Aliiruegeria sabulilitoris]
MRMFKVLCVAMATALPLSPLMAETAASGKLVVTGEGRVAAVPDMALITLGAVAEDAEAGLAMRQMSERIAAIHQRLEDAGIAPRDIQTGQLSLVPRRAQPKANGGQGEIEAFIAASDVTIRLRDLGTLGQLLDMAVADGANTLRGLRFDLQEPGPVEDEALRAAVADARRKAELLAEAAGIGLGPILSIEENGMGSARPMRATMASAMREGMPVAAGELDVEAVVTITWALAQ